MPELISTTQTCKAHATIQTAFRKRMRVRKLATYQFDFEHGQWWVTHKPSGAVWSVIDTSYGVDFELIEGGR